MANEIKIKLTIDGKEAIATLDKAQLGLDETTQKGANLNSTFDQIKTTAVGNFLAQQFSNAIAGLKQLIAESEQLAANQERQEAKIVQLVKVTGQASGFSAEELKEQAARLQTLTTTGDETILAIQSKLLTFKSIQGDIFEGLVELALDTGELFGSAESAILQYGKAFEDPARNLSQLRRVGITFSEEQENQIKNLQENNQLVDAQNVLMDVLKGQLGGVAQAMAQTDSGKIQQFNNRLSDTQEKIGAVLQRMKVEMIPVWDSLLDVTNRLIIREKSQVDVLKEEQFEINKLVNEILFLNPENEKRKNLIASLNEDYPDLLQNIDSEVISNQQLLEVLKKSNEEKANQILVQKQLDPVITAHQKAVDAQNKLDDERSKLIGQITSLELKHGVTIREKGIELDKQNTSVQELHEAVRVFGIALNQNISIQEAEDRIRNSAVMGLSEHNIAVSDAARSRENLNKLLKDSETFLLASGLSQEFVNEKLQAYREFLGISAEASENSSSAINENQQQINLLREEYQELLNLVGSQKELEELKKQIEDLGGSVADITPEFSTFGEQLKPLTERLKELKDIQGPTEEQEAEIAQIQAKIDKLNEQKKVQESLRTEDFKPGAVEAPEDVIIEDDPGEFQPVQMDTDPIVAQYNNRQLAAMELWELQSHLYDLERAKSEATSQAKVNAFDQEIDATLHAMAVEQNRIEAQRAIGQSIANQILYAESVREGTKAVMKAISAEIIALMIRNALQTAGASGPLALIVAPALIAGGTAIANKAIDSIPGFKDGGKIKGGKQLVYVNEEGEEMVISAPSTNIAEQVLSFINESPENARIVQDNYTNVIKNEVAGIPAFAEGGDFITQGPQLIMVGDNPGGKERVQVTPISSDNKFGPQETKAPKVNVIVKNNVNYTTSVRSLKDEIDELTEIEETVGN
ncbi:MAG: hypothetical protein ABJI69_09280 [Balneola sp.]